MSSSSPGVRVDVISSRSANGKRAADHRAGGEHLLRFWAEPLEPAPDDEAHALRDVELVDLDVGAEARRLVEDLALLDQVPEHLLDEERVALGLVEHRADDRVGRRACRRGPRA